eukprot:SRR837773.362.p1 GENE.SRR837773.362~~SRR837773.362.p1  ORF type:complete len:454 (+),score=84.08 SRR837773.362:207-1364(+)
MYRYLWSNGPKECLEFADYSFEEHFGKAIPSFPPREVLFDYIRGRVDKADVRKWIRFNQAVRNVVFSDDSQKFTVTSRDVVSNTDSMEEFDNVIVCTGHFSTPNVPYFPGFEKFEGRVLHAHDFRDAREFEGKDILVIGTSYSAEDISSQCYKYGCKSVTLSWRTNPMGFHWPENFTTVPLLTHTVGKTCHFKDGSTKDVDAIILCTGYQHHFPFMHDSLRLKTANRLWIDSLYNGTVWEANPKLFYIGMQDQWYTFNMFDAQAWYVRDIILGRLTVPSMDEMKADFAAWRAREATLESDEDNIRYQGDYVKKLMDMTDYPPYDIEKSVQIFLEWEHNKHENIMTFRDCSHTSVLTGTTSPVHHTPWLKAMDDSMACYMADKSSS